MKDKIRQQNGIDEKIIVNKKDFLEIKKLVEKLQKKIKMIDKD